MEIQTFESKIRLIPGVWLKIRSCIVPVEGNQAILVSPIQFTENEVRQIRQVYKITDLVAPNLLHHKFMGPAQKHFPSAKVWGVQGIREKCPDVKWDRIFLKDQWPYGNQISLHAVEGAEQINEILFLHKASRTLLMTDLCFNISKPEGFLAPVVFLFMNTYKKFNISNLWNKIITDKEKFKKSVLKLLDLDFDRIIMAHGDIISENGHGRMKRVIENKESLFAN